MKGEFIIKRNGKMETYKDYDDIPSSFEHLISFRPEYPESPHTAEDHELLGTYNNRFQRLMDIERSNIL